MKFSGEIVRPMLGMMIMLTSSLSLAVDSSFTLGIEGRGLIGDADQADIIKDDFAISAEAEFVTSFNDDDTTLTFTPFGRWDHRDSERDHFDIRELNVLHVSGNWEVLAGISKVYWGVAESNHLVDIINQTDILEGSDGEDKLGQPMLRVSRIFDQSTLSVFVLPGFRERQYLSTNNPLSLPFVVENEPDYESDDADDHVDFALRYSGYAGIMDYGVSWFSGTDRSPLFIPGSAEDILKPHYQQVDQFGIDAQITNEAWLWKLEAVHRQTESENYNAVVGGVEYSIYGLRDGLFDLGLLAEYSHDGREDTSTVLLQEDLFLGARFGFTDAASSEMLAGVILDQENDTIIYRAEGNRRVFTDSKISLEAQAVSTPDSEASTSVFLQLTFEMFF